MARLSNAGSTIESWKTGWGARGTRVHTTFSESFQVARIPLWVIFMSENFHEKLEEAPRIQFCGYKIRWCLARYFLWMTYVNFEFVSRGVNLAFASVSNLA